MALTLFKGQNLSLTKTDPGLTEVPVGLGWDERQTDGSEFDLDASAFLLNAAGQTRKDADFIYYNQRNSACGSVSHTGANRTGEGAGDDGAIKVDLGNVPEDVQTIAITITIHDFEARAAVLLPCAASTG